VTTLPGEVAGLPEGGPATLASVKTWLQLDPEVPTPRDARFELVIGAVNDQVRTWPVAQKSVNPDPEVEPAWRPSTVLGASMLVVRLERRGDSPDGVAAFGTEGPVYVQRIDPEIAQLLDLGAWQKVTVG